MNQYWEHGDSAIHKNGLCAKCDIPKGTRIIEYVGDVLTPEEMEARANARISSAFDNGDGLVYAFSLKNGMVLDGNVEYNDAGKINHSCDENCDAIYTKDGLQVWIHAKRDILKGEELTYDYKFESLDYYEAFPCNCGSKNCCGYIIDSELRPKLREILKNKSQLVS